MKKIFFVVAALSMSLMMWAVPARRNVRTVLQADGSEMKVYAHGDEHFHWYTNTDGEWLKEGEDGLWRVVEPLTDDAIMQRRQSARRISNRRRAVGVERNIAPRGLIILVNFSDLSFTTSTEEMVNMLTSDNYTRQYSFTYEGERVSVKSEGSARHYFYDTSRGQYNPQFDVVGPVTVSQKMSYYGKNVGDEDQYPEKMIQEACKLADQQYNINFADYDNNNDGYVDFVYVFYAGYGEADGGSSNTIWPHSWNLTEGNAQITLDGKIIDLYACGSELSFVSKKHDGIGTFCHEFSHVLGLPDFYATTDEATWKTMGQWDIMDYGPYNNDGNTPPLYSGYELFFMGWVTPRVLNSYEQVTLNPSNEDGEILLISSTGKHNLNGLDPNPASYYVLENRQRTGWDAYLPGHGMMLTKVQYSDNKWYNNTVNNTKSQLGMDIVEADGKAPSYNEDNPENGYFGKATDLFPAGATSYTKISGYPIRNIKETGGVITFQFMDDDSGQGSVDPSGEGSCSAYSYVFEKKAEYGSSVVLDDYTWNMSAEDESFVGYEAERGWQLGSSKKPAQSVVMTTNDIVGCTISRVTVNAAMAAKGDGQLSVYIGGEQLGDNKSLTTTATDYIFSNTSNLTGSLELRFTNTQKAMYIKSIDVTFNPSATDISTVENTQKRKADKLLRNGQLIIRINGNEYDAQGQLIKSNR